MAYKMGNGIAKKLMLVFVLFQLSLEAISRKQSCEGQSEIIIPSSTFRSVTCECYDNQFIAGVIVHCRNLHQDNLANISPALFNYNITKLSIQNSVFSEIPNSTFHGMSIRILSFIQTEIGTFHLFSGLTGIESALYQLNIYKCTVENWVLSSGIEFKALSDIYLSDRNNVDMNMISFFPSGLRYLFIDIGGLSSINSMPNLSRMKDLGVLVIRDANITTFNRSCLPQPANELFTLNLGGNPITYLPEDALTEMPHLSYLVLIDTSITTLSSEVFQHLSPGGCDEPSSLKVNTLGVPLHCDCNIAWVKRGTIPFVNVHPRTECQSPENLKGRELKDLTIEDLCPAKNFVLMFPDIAL